jgi:hypothetical protein
VGGRDFAGVVDVGEIGEALVVHDDVVGFGPVRVFVEFDFGVLGGAALVDDGPRDGAKFLGGGDERFRLEGVVVTATAGDEERTDGFGFGGGAGERRGQRWRTRVTGE